MSRRPREAFSTLSKGFQGIAGFLDDQQHDAALNSVFYNTYSYFSPSPTLLHAWNAAIVPTGVVLLNLSSADYVASKPEREV